VRNGYTWGPAGAGTDTPGMPAKIVMRVIPNQTTQANLLLAGELNFGQVSEQDKARLDARQRNLESPVAGTWLRFNQLDGRAGADQRVRQAMVMALDTTNLIKISTAGTGSAPTGLVVLPPKPCAGDTVAGQLPKQDVAAAQRLLDEAGWRKGADGFRAKNGKQLRMTVPYAPSYAPLDQPTAEFLAQQWKAIGVGIDLKTVTAGEIQQLLFKTSNWDIYIGGSNYSLPSQMVPFLSGTVPPNGNNYAGIRNKAYEAAAARALTQPLPQACAQWNQAEQAIVRNLDVVPLTNRAQHWFMSGVQLQTGRYVGPIPTTIRLES
jgi:peptide/nickel transport system substrate-binding protein